VSSSTKILFWPGLGKDLTILSCFLANFREKGYDITVVPFEYDFDIMPFYKNSDWCDWLEENAFDWWIGISLGASLSYTMATFVNEKRSPIRITAINPFSSREILSKEKSFSLQGQWNFSPISYDLKIQSIDAVVSLYDEKIPMYHGISLLNHTISPKKNLIFVNDSHQIQNDTAQSELVSNLLEEVDCGRNHYCFIYKP
jgi:esterase/lipase